MRPKSFASLAVSCVHFLVDLLNLIDAEVLAFLPYVARLAKCFNAVIAVVVGLLFSVSVIC